MAFLYASSGEKLYIRAILATDNSGVIGYDNHLVFNNPADLVFFQRTTEGSVCVMGRKTFESIGKILKNRQTVILTRNPEPVQQLVNSMKRPARTPKPLVITNFEKELPPICDKRKTTTVFICGGAEIYRLCSKYTSAFLVTRYMISVEEQAREEAARLRNLRMENKGRMDRYESDIFNLPEDPKETFIPPDYDPEKLITFSPGVYESLYCIPVESGKFCGVRYATRMYRRGRAVSPKSIIEQEKLNRVRFQLDPKELDKREYEGDVKKF